MATILEPAGVVGDTVALKVKDTAKFGILMDWGLEKDLLDPRSEQQGRMELGETHLVKICLDESSHRIYWSTLTAEFGPGPYFRRGRGFYHPQHYLHRLYCPHQPHLPGHAL